MTICEIVTILYVDYDIFKMLKQIKNFDICPLNIA